MTMDTDVIPVAKSHDISWTIPIAINVGFTAFLIGFFVHGFVESRSSSSGGVRPIPFTQEELQSTDPVFADLIPMEIRLRFVTDEEFEARKPTTNTIAFTSLAAPLKPCEIVIPASYAKIMVIPSKMHSPLWIWEYSGGDTMAHEVLHCMKGMWHEQ